MGCLVLVVGVVCPLCTRRGGRGGGAPAEEGGAGDSSGGESGPEAYEEELDLELSWSLAISSRSRSASGIQLLSPLFSTAGPPNSDDAERVGLGIDFEMSRPSGFLRDMDDLTEPKVEADALEPVDASSAGEDCDDKNGGRVGAGRNRSSKELPDMLGRRGYECAYEAKNGYCRVGEGGCTWASESDQKGILRRTTKRGESMRKVSE